MEELELTPLKKDHWKYIATHFNIEFCTSMRKSQLNNKTISGLVNVDILGSDAMYLMDTDVSPPRVSATVSCNENINFQLQ